MPHRAGAQPSCQLSANHGLRERVAACLHGSVVRPIRNLHARPMKNGYALGALRPHVTHSLGLRLSMRWFDSQSDRCATTSSLTGKESGTHPS